MNTKMIAAFIVTLMALSIFGFVYSAWTDKVNINGTVHMGELIVGILSDPKYPDMYIEVVETTNGYPEDERGHGFEPKPWVADTTVTLEDFEASVHHETPETVAHTMNITVNNAYPQYDKTGLVKNAATNPQKKHDCDFEGYDEKDDEELRYTGEWTWNATLKCWIFEGKIWDNGSDNEWTTEDDVVIINLYVVVFAPEDMQLEPCHEYPFEITFDFKQEAEECHTYLLYFELLGVQWNKLGEVLP